MGTETPNRPTERLRSKPSRPFGPGLRAQALRLDAVLRMLGRLRPEAVAWAFGGAPPGSADAEADSGERTNKHNAGREAFPPAVAAALAEARSPASDPLPGAPIANALLKATALHARLMKIPTFAGDNGRVARALESTVLLRAGVPALVANELQLWYDEDRPRYLRALDEAERCGADRFVAYALSGLKRRLRQRLQEAIGQRPFARRHFLRAGFTLVELVVVVLILGILAGIAAPKLFNQTTQAVEAAEAELVNRIRDGIEYYYINSVAEGAAAFPTELDSGTGACSGSAPCFTEVLRDGVIDPQWVRASTNVYESPAGEVYIYDPATGAFEPP